MSDRDILRARAAALAKPVLEAGQRGRIMATFSLAGAQLALDLRFLREALRVPALLPLPGAPLVQGLALLRGEVLPVFFLGPLLGLPSAAAQPGPGARLLVLGEEQPELGLVVDEISGTREFLESEVSPLGAGAAGSSPCLGLAPDGTLLLDGARLLADPRFRLDS